MSTPPAAQRPWLRWLKHPMRGLWSDGSEETWSLQLGPSPRSRRVPDTPPPHLSLSPPQRGHWGAPEVREEMRESEKEGKKGENKYLRKYTVPLHSSHVDNSQCYYILMYTASAHSTYMYTTENYVQLTVYISLRHVRTWLSPALGLCTHMYIYTL